MAIRKVLLVAIAYAAITMHDAPAAMPHGNHETALCPGQPTIPGPVYITFDDSYSLYSWRMHWDPVQHAYQFERNEIPASHVADLCNEGFDVRAIGARDLFPVAVEYHHADLDHYFLATDPAEIRDLDAGLHRGWSRTGEQFRIYVSDPSWPSSQAPLAPSCRYYGLPEFGLNTHFFSALPEECTAIGSNWPDRWRLETAAAFRAHLPDASGACPAGTQALYRVFNNRPDVNHRYTTSRSIRQRMIDRSWIPEGSGPMGVAMCVRPM
jgi:hypothetical protein